MNADLYEINSNLTKINEYSSLSQLESNILSLNQSAMSFLKNCKYD